MNAHAMLTTPSPRPWMPHRRRRAALARTTVARRATPSLQSAGIRRQPPSHGRTLLHRLRALFRHPPTLTFRLDELTAETEAWNPERPGGARPRR